MISPHRKAFSNEKLLCLIEATPIWWLMLLPFWLLYSKYRYMCIWFWIYAIGSSWRLFEIYSLLLCSCFMLTVWRLRVMTSVKTSLFFLRAYILLDHGIGSQLIDESWKCQVYLCHRGDTFFLEYYCFCLISDNCSIVGIVMISALLFFSIFVHCAAFYCQQFFPHLIFWAAIKRWKALKSGTFYNVAGTMWKRNWRGSDSMESGPYPERPGEPDCAYYIRTGLCRFGMTCKFNHPPNRMLVMEVPMRWSLLDSAIWYGSIIILPFQLLVRFPRIALSW